MYSASVRSLRGTASSANAPAGPAFDAAARGTYASVDDFLQEADDAVRSERFRMYIKIIMVSLRVEESAPEAAKLSWAGLLDNDTVAALDDCAQLDDFRVAIQTFWHDKRRALRASAGAAAGAGAVAGGGQTGGSQVPVIITFLLAHGPCMPYF